MSKFIYWLKYIIILSLAVYFISIKGGVAITNLIFTTFSFNLAFLIIVIILVMFTSLTAHLLYYLSTLEERIYIKYLKNIIKELENIRIKYIELLK